MRAHSSLTLRGMVLFSLLLSACDRTPPTRPDGTPAPGGNPFIVSTEIVGPRTVPPGETVQFSLMVRFSDGTTKDVTQDAGWQSGFGVHFDFGARTGQGEQRGQRNHQRYLRLGCVFEGCHRRAGGHVSTDGIRV